jgi:hypothetical protein
LRPAIPIVNVGMARSAKVGFVLLSADIPLIVLVGKSAPPPATAGSAYQRHHRHHRPRLRHRYTTLKAASAGQYDWAASADLLSISDVHRDYNALDNCPMEEGLASEPSKAAIPIGQAIDKGLGRCAFGGPPRPFPVEF